MFLFYIFTLVTLEFTVTAKSTYYVRSGSPVTGQEPLELQKYPASPGWQYDNDTFWPGSLCRPGIGKRQSPIDIQTSAVVLDVNRQIIQYGNLKLYGYQSVLVSAVNNGRTIQFTMDGDEAMHPTLTGGPLKYLYRLEQLHFHWLSEHAVNGFKYPMEIHFVHIRADLSTAEALRKRDGMAIIAVFGNIKSEVENDDNSLATDMMEEVVRQLPHLPEPGDHVSGIVLNISKLLMGDHQSYMTYSGSLTSPECNEVVTWIIMDTPAFMTYGQYKDFIAVTTNRYNFRRLQSSNLTVYRPASIYMRQPMIIRVFADMYDVVAKFFSNMKRMLQTAGPVLVPK